MKFDFHTHHERCGHATGSIREYINEAIEKGLHSIGISDHTPLFASEEDHPSPGGTMAKSEFPKYVQEVLELKKEYAGKIEVLLGVEVDFIPQHIDLYRKIINSYPFDYVIGSVHNYQGISIYDGKYWDSLTSQEKVKVKEKYYDYISQSAESRMFDILGHVDALKRYYSGYTDVRTEETDFTLKKIADNDVVIEINSSDENWAPGTDFLERALYFGVKVTFGSDAHKPEEVGNHFEAVKKQLKEIGFREWATFRERKRFMQPL
ncbi:histidinol-phosphatase [Bacillus sp. IITD106]|nr:histidinol-phosphatase [Bacillus sp. IITD106]